MFTLNKGNEHVKALKTQAGLSRDKTQQKTELISIFPLFNSYIRTECTCQDAKIQREKQRVREIDRKFHNLLL